jgi:hypothetical protein
MSQIEGKDFINSLNYLFKETFEGSPSQGSIYLDRGIGVFNTIENLDANTASSFNSATTIASHVEHLRYYLEVLSNFMQGIVKAADWNESWAKKEVSEEEWKTLKTNLHLTYESVLTAYEKVESWDEDKMSEAMAIVVHTAYHLGAIRQMTKSFEPIVLTKVH